MQVEMMPVDRLIPYIRNSRAHSADQVAQIAASIVEFGFTNPLLTGEDGVIIAGHGRLLATKHLELAKVPVILLNHLSEAQRRALVIADNRIADNVGWDDEMLRAELVALREEDFDLDLLGFDDAAIDDLLAGLGDPMAPPTASGEGAEGDVSPASPSVPGNSGALAERFGVPPSRFSMPAKAGGRNAKTPGWTSASARNSAVGPRRAEAPARWTGRRRRSPHVAKGVAPDLRAGFDARRAYRRREGERRRVDAVAHLG